MKGVHLNLNVEAVMRLIQAITMAGASALVVAMSYGCSSTTTVVVEDSGTPTPEGGSKPDTSTGNKDSGDQNQDSAPPPSCAPVDVSSFMAPAYVPAKHANVCTVSAIMTYDADCNTPPGTGCSAFEAANKTCVACLLSQDSDPSYGAIVNHQAQGIESDNVAGCIELEGNKACATAYQALGACEAAACPPSVCPVTDQTSLTAYEGCAKAADSGGCKSFATAANSCIAADDGGPITTICLGGTDFHSIFLSIAPVFCGYPDGG